MAKNNDNPKASADVQATEAGLGSFPAAPIAGPPPFFVSLTAEEQAALSRAHGFAGTAYLMVMPTVPGMDVVEKLVQGIHQKIAVVETGFHDVKQEVVAWRTDYRDVQNAKARLEKMQSEGLMTFTAKVDAKSFQVLCAIIACGNAAKASRALKMGDSTVRDVIRSWKKLGPSYAVMTDLVRWRKCVGGKYTVPFNDKLLYEKDATATDNETFLSDLLNEVLSMTESNWKDICADLESTLKKQLGK